MSSKQLAIVLMGVVFIATACGAEDPPPAKASPQIFADVPAEVDPDARYLIYLHGAIVETEGVRPTHVGSESTNTRRFWRFSPGAVLS